MKQVMAGPDTQPATGRSGSLALRGPESSSSRALHPRPALVVHLHCPAANRPTHLECAPTSTPSVPFHFIIQCHLLFFFAPPHTLSSIRSAPGFYSNYPTLLYASHVLSLLLQTTAPPDCIALHDSDRQPPRNTHNNSTSLRN